MKFAKRVMATAAGLLMVLGVLAITPVTDTSKEMVPATHGSDDADVTRGGFLQVYSVNWENLPKADWKPESECAGDWRDLLHYMRFGPEVGHGADPRYTPDLLLVQQIDGQAELDFLVQEMTDKLDGVYAGVIANRTANEDIRTCHTIDENGNVVQEKDEQTNAVIYRTGRFGFVEKWGWQSNVWRLRDTGGFHCTNNSQDRTRNVAVRLVDKIYTGEPGMPGGQIHYVTAASVHWPTARQGGRECAGFNWREAVNEMDEPADDELRIIGGDFNVPDTVSEDSWDWRAWYQAANGDLPPEGDDNEASDYRDVIYQHCTEPGKVLTDCLENNWTFDRRPGPNPRIDFLFAQADGGIGDIDLPEVHAEHTVTFNEGDSADNHVGDGDNEALSYSQHRAIRARIHYRF